MDKKILYKFFEGKVSAEEKERIREWLSDPANQQIMIEEREFFNALHLSNTKYERPVKKRNEQPKIRFIIREFLKIAAIIIFTAGIAGLFFISKMNDIKEAMNIVHVPPGQRVNLTLPDGTHVSLNAGSELRYSAYFSGSNREVQLNGEAFFNVKHNEQKPFVVHTRKCDIEVLGTKFNVESYDNSDDFSTSLIEGSVKLTNAVDFSDILILRPDSQATFRNGKLRADLIQDYDYFRWQEGLICFKDMEFGELMTRFEKYYDVKIIVENKDISKKIFSGKFRVSDGIDNALRILQKDTKYIYEKNHDATVLYIK